MLEFAHLHGLGDQVSAAETLAVISHALLEHETLDGLAALTQVGASTLLNFGAASATLAERSFHQVVLGSCVLGIMAWHCMSAHPKGA